MAENAQSEFNHIPVLLAESIDALCIDPDGVYVDCTAGGGGHSERIASHLTTGRLIAIDRDAEAVCAASERLSRFGEHVTVIHDNFRNLKAILAGLGIEKVNGVLADLGVSSHQIDVPERGFSYMQDAALDMRMDRSNGITAFDIVNTWDKNEIQQILRDFGEERLAGKIASEIVRRRENGPITTTGMLADLVCDVYPPRHDGHPAKRTFQAIRIAVNQELEIIPEMIRASADVLKPGGRLAIITFHSLEDRAVKSAIAALAEGCVCPPDFPVCVCGHHPQLRPVNKKAIPPSEKEMEENPRSKSAKLRIAERTEY